MEGVDNEPFPVGSAIPWDPSSAPGDDLYAGSSSDAYACRIVADVIALLQTLPDVLISQMGPSARAPYPLWSTLSKIANFALTTGLGVTNEVVSTVDASPTMILPWIEIGVAIYWTSKQSFATSAYATYSSVSSWVGLAKLEWAIAQVVNGSDTNAGTAYPAISSPIPQIINGAFPEGLKAMPNPILWAGVSILEVAIFLSDAIVTLVHDIDSDGAVRRATA